MSNPETPPVKVSFSKMQHQKLNKCLFQRYRREEKNSNSESEDDNYVPYVPVKERKKQQLLKLGRIAQVDSKII